MSKCRTDLDDLWKEYDRSGSTELRNRLVEEYLPLVKYHVERAKKKLPRYVDPDDLEIAGAEGLMRAVEKFDLARKLRFETYASQRVWGAIVDELRVPDWTPRPVRLKANKIERARDALTAELSREPTLSEIARRAGLSRQEVEDVERDLRTHNQFSMDALVSDDGNGGAMVQTIPDRRKPDPSELAALRELRELVFKGLQPSESLVVDEYYWGEKTMKEIGAMLGVSESRVSQIRAQALELLRKRFKEVA